MSSEIYLIVHNVRSCYNVGSLLRTADAFAVSHVYLTGYSPYPKLKDDPRLPHIAERAASQIHKSALGAENSLSCSHEADLLGLLTRLRAEGVVIAALEQTEKAVPLPSYAAPERLALIVGREVEGVEDEILKVADVHLQIPMLGKKESLNVASAAAVALYQLRFNLKGNGQG